MVFRIGHLGDTLVSLPAFWATRNAFPDAHIAFLSNTNLSRPGYVTPGSVLPTDGLFDEWITYPSGIGLVENALALARLLYDLRRSRFDTLVYLTTRVRSSMRVRRDLIFFRLAGIKQVVGARHLAENLLDHDSPAPLKKVDPEWKFLLDCLAADHIGLNSKPITDVGSTTADIEAADLWIQINCLPRQRLIAIAPSAKWESKKWPESRYRSVVARLISEHQVFPVVFGGPEDREMASRLLEDWKVGANAAGELDVRTAMAALTRCEMYLGNDTGTMHMAASVGVRCVAIFAALDWPGRWFPFGSGHRVFREPVECEGCATPDCFNHHKCLDLISEVSVYDACNEILAPKRIA